MLRRRQFLGGIASTFAASTIGPFCTTRSLADAQTEWDKAVAESMGQELNLVIDPWTPHRTVVEIFGRKFPGIKIQPSNLHPSDAAPRIIAEQKNGLFAWDSWWGTTSSMTNLMLPANGLEKISDFLILPKVIDPSNWLLPNHIYTSKRGPYVFVHTHWLANYGAYNTGLVPGGVLTLDNILDPSLKGKISIRVPDRPHGGSMMLAEVAKEKGMATVEKLLTTMQPIFINNDRQNIMSVIQGDTAVGIGTAEEPLFECHANKGCANVKKFPVSVMHSRGVAVFRNAPHKAATKVWVNWLLSKEGQEAYVQEWAKSTPTGALSMRKDVKPNPHHLDSMPDIANVDQYVAVGLESGWDQLRAVINLYKKLRG